MATKNINIQIAVGNAIRDRRVALGMSQEQLATKAQLHRTYISDIERGARNISLSSVDKLAGALEWKVSELIAKAEQAHHWAENTHQACGNGHSDEACLPETTEVEHKEPVAQEA